MFKELREKLNKKKKEITDKTSTKRSLLKYGLIFCLGSGVCCLLSGFILPGITMLSLAGGTIIADSNNEVHAQSRISRINSELTNLNRLATNKIDTSNDAMLRRKKQIENLQKDAVEKESKANTSKLVNNILNAGLVVSACASIATPGLLTAVPAILAITKGIQNNQLSVNIDKEERAKAKLNNTQNEQSVAAILQKVEKQKRQNAQKVVQNNNTYSKQMNNTRGAQPVRKQSYYNPVFTYENTQGGYKKVR